MRYRAAAGEANSVTFVRSHFSVSDFDFGRIRVLDLGAPVTAGPYCLQVDARTADCWSDRLSVDARLGDRDDVAEAVVGSGDGSTKFDFWGEAGNDRLVIPAYESFYGNLRGGAGDDVLHGFGPATSGQLLDGGPGADQIVGGRAPDTLRDGDPEDDLARDLIDGGGGQDILSYGPRSKAVRVDLAAGRGGELGAEDTLAHVEGAVGGGGDDVLLGSPRRDVLDGRRGEDVIRGRGGADRLIARDGDRASGGAGNDSFAVRGVARIDCGHGRDDILELTRGPDVGPSISRDCEGVGQNVLSGSDTPTGIFVDPRARVSRLGRIRLRFRCGDCDRGRLKVTSARRPFQVLARGAFRLHRTDDFLFWARGAVAVSLPPRISRRVRRRHRRLRFVLRTPPHRVVWSIHVGP
jgi:RTX calcium-binding nonapeptide repeat (4 copies)